MTTRTTSLNAYYGEVLPNIGAKQQSIIELFISTGKDKDYTNSEISQKLGWGINRVTPRVYELRQQGLLEEAQRRSCRITGRTAIAWKLKNNS